MSTSSSGRIGWIDLTAPDAERVRAFYEKVVGWVAGPVAMDGYDDYCMAPDGGSAPVAGICHARGSNAGMPAQWLIYITVDDLDESLRAVVDSGGEVMTPPRDAGDGRFAVIRDPAGAACALYQTAAEPDDDRAAGGGE